MFLPFLSYKPSKDIELVLPIPTDGPTKNAFFLIISFVIVVSIILCLMVAIKLLLIESKGHSE
jgi:hypothetical protein